MYALVDCNSCYASCEQIFRPDLRDKPVVVLSNNDGCIIARSKEAKALGIPDLDAYFKLAPLLRNNKVHIFSANFTLYGDVSHRVMTTLKQYSPEVEVYSIDEMFLYLSGMGDWNLKTFAQEIKKTVWKEVRMPVCVGIAPSKTLSKLANHAAKKIPQANGVCVLDTAGKWRWVLRRMPVNKVWGVGAAFSKKLNGLSIYSAYDLASADPKRLRQQFNVNIERTINELNGIACIALDEQPPAKKNIFCTRSFGDKPCELKPIEDAVSAYAARAAEKLRAQNHYVKTLQVFINTSPFEPDYYSRSVIVKLPYGSNDTRMIAGAAKRAVKQIFIPGKRYLKAGVGLIDLHDKRFMQSDLFQAGQPIQAEQLMSVMDKINQRYGQGASFLAAEGSKKRWRMRQNFLSPCYTTRWADIPSIQCD